MLVESSMRALRKPIETHKKHMQGGKTRVSENDFTSIGVITPMLGHNPITHFKDRMSKIFHENLGGI